MPVAQWLPLERPTGVQKVMGSMPIGDSDEFVSFSHAHDRLIITSFLICSASLKFTIFLSLSPTGHFDIADPSFEPFDNFLGRCLLLSLHTSQLTER